MLQDLFCFIFHTVFAVKEHNSTHKFNKNKILDFNNNTCLTPSDFPAGYNAITKVSHNGKTNGRILAKMATDITCDEKFNVFYTEATGYSWEVYRPCNVTAVEPTSDVCELDCGCNTSESCDITMILVSYEPGYTWGVCELWIEDA